MKKKLTFGIQGGPGSFNEEAIHYYLERADIKNFEIKYLYTTENVLKELKEGKIDFGQFALFNLHGGVVDESIEAMGKYSFKVADRYAIVISHALMIRKDAEFPEITEIMSHPQVFAQCRDNLLEKYSHLKLVSGQGKLIDQSRVAEQLKKKKLPKNIATMGSKIIAKVYGLKMVEEDLQDVSENYTTFLLVKK
jgi:prephenate dehydratase